MFELEIGEIIGILEESEQVQLLKVDYEGQVGVAFHYLQFHSPLRIGDKAIFNRTATRLRLGTGGYDFVVSSLNREQFKNKHDTGHIMKLRYTPYQFAASSCEEQESPYHHILKDKKSIDHLPVIIGELHSMLPILVTSYRQLEMENRKKKRKIVYIMTDGAALPIAFSRHVSMLKELDWVNYTITVGHAFGGDLEAINIYTALLAARYVYQADFVVVLMGPGIVGTGTLLGHTGVEQGEIVNAVAALNGRAISIVRASDGDSRERHKGISHHTLTSLSQISQANSIVPYPKYVERKRVDMYQDLLKLNKKHQLIAINMKSEQVKNFLTAYPKVITTMGRTVEADPIFFDFVASTAYYIYSLLDE